MPRYYSKTRASLPRNWEIDEGWPMLPEIHVPESYDQPTGLLDNEGNMIYRTPNPIGFHRWD